MLSSHLQDKPLQGAFWRRIADRSPMVVVFKLVYGVPDFIFGGCFV